MVFWSLARARSFSSSRRSRIFLTIFGRFRDLTMRFTVGMCAWRSRSAAR